MKTVYWGIGRGYCGQMRPESIGLGQMEDHIFGRKKGDYFLLGLQPISPHQTLLDKAGYSTLTKQFEGGLDQSTMCCLTNSKNSSSWRCDMYLAKLQEISPDHKISEEEDPGNKEEDWVGEAKTLANYSTKGSVPGKWLTAITGMLMCLKCSCDHKV